MRYTLHVFVSLFAVISCSERTQNRVYAHETAREKARTGNLGDDMENQYKKPGQAELRRRLSSEQYAVTQQCGTEPPFHNAYWDNHAPGIYIDVVSGEPLFSSIDKFDSGTGWPSFTKPLEPANLVERKDLSHTMKRVEVRSKTADSHLGHVFEDGPQPDGLRYCVNSAALRFIPANRLVEEGYGRYAALFPQVKQTKDEVTKAVERQVAILAGGCFWGMENILRKISGVLETQVGYTGGSVRNPSYEQVTTGKTGHAEAVRIVFDPNVLSYEKLLNYFFRMHDPTTLNRQENDIGPQYRSAIFFTSSEQKQIAERVKSELDNSHKWKKSVVTEIVPASQFYPAESFHQDYLLKNPNGYNCHYLRD